VKFRIIKYLRLRLIPFSEGGGCVSHPVDDWSRRFRDEIRTKARPSAPENTLTLMHYLRSCPSRDLWEQLIDGLLRNDLGLIDGALDRSGFVQFPVHVKFDGSRSAFRVDPNSERQAPKFAEPVFARFAFFPGRFAHLARIST
jgi:hypothetical protein